MQPGEVLGSLVLKVSALGEANTLMIAEFPRCELFIGEASNLFVHLYSSLELMVARNSLHNTFLALKREKVDFQFE